MHRKALSFFADQKSQNRAVEASIELASMFIPNDVIKLILQQLSQTKDTESLGRLSQVNHSFYELIKSAFADDKLNPRMSFFWKKQPQIKIAGWLPKDMELNQEILSNMLYIYVGIALLIEIGIIDSGIISSSQPISTLLKFLALNVGFMLGASTLLYVGESIIDRVASEISCEKGLKTNISSLRF